MLTFLFDETGASVAAETTAPGTPTVTVTATMDAAEKACRFTAAAAQPLPREITLWLGDECIARIGGLWDASDVTLPMARFFAMPLVRFTARGLEGKLCVCASGNIFRIPLLSTEADIVHHIQHTPTRFKERELLRLAAKHVYHAKSDDFVLRAMAIVILGYRFLDAPKAEPAPADRAELEWILRECTVLVPQGAAMLADRAKADWRVYRWTLSVAKMAGYLAISIEDYALASSFFGFANAHWEWVETIPASGANIATMTCLNGMLLLMLGEREAGIASLSLCVARMSWFIAQQHLYLSVSSYSESKEIVRTGCQAFTLLALAGGLPAGGRRPQLHNRRFDLGEVWPFLVHRMILGGRCGRLKAFLLESGLAHEADLTPPPRKPAAG